MEVESREPVGCSLFKNRGRDVIFDESKFCSGDDLSGETLSSELNLGSEREISEDLIPADFQEEILESCIENVQKEETSGTPFRRGSRTTIKPKYLDDYTVLALHAETYIENVLQNFSDIKNRIDKDKWFQAS